MTEQVIHCGSEDGGDSWRALRGLGAVFTHYSIRNM